MNSRGSRYRVLRLLAAHYIEDLAHAAHADFVERLVRVRTNVRRNDETRELQQRVIRVRDLLRKYVSCCSAKMTALQHFPQRFFVDKTAALLRRQDLLWKY